MVKTTQKIPPDNIKMLLFFMSMFCFVVCIAQSPAVYNLDKLYDFNAKAIYGLYQAKDKKVWIATDQGLYAFNGKTFKKYINPEFKNEFHNIREDTTGRIWCSNFAGQIFYVENNVLRLFKDVNEYTSSGVLTFTVVRFPQIYVGTNYGYLIIDFYNSNNTKHFQTHTWNKKEYKILRDKDTIYFDFVDHIQLYKNTLIYNGFNAYNALSTVNTVQKNNTQTLFTIKEHTGIMHLFSHDDMILVVSENQDRRIHIHYYQNDSLQMKTYREFPERVRNVFYYDAHLQKYWVGTYNGAFLLDKTLESMGEAFHLLKGHAVSGILRDHEGNYWIATLHSGIYIMPSLQIRVLNNENSPLIKNNIVSMQKTSAEQLLLTDNLGHVYEYQIRKNKLTREFNIGSGIGAIVHNPIRNTVHFEGRYNTYHLNTKQLNPSIVSDFKAGTVIDSINFLVSHSGGAYISNFKSDNAELPMDKRWQKHYKLTNKSYGNGTLLNRLELRQRRSYTNTVCKSTQTLYVAYSDGLFAYKNAEEYHIIYNNKPLIITAFQPATGKGVWATDTEGRLFYILNDKAKLVTSFGVEIKHICQHDSTLLLGTHKGIFTYHTKTRQKDIINTLDGLPSNAVTGLVVANDTVYASTLKGLAMIPAAYHYKNTVPPEVELTNVSVNGKARSIGKILQLNSKENSLNFAFNAYALRSQKTFRYAYRVLEIDSSWTTTQSNSIALTGLAPGRYTFRVKAINEDGVESTNVKEVSFIIAKPFYQQWWFYVLLVAATVGLVAYLYNSRIKNIKRQNRMQERELALENDLKASRMTALKAQMNPHFLFNAMNAIQSLILRGSRDDAYKYLTRFSWLIRENLNRSDKNFVWFNDELKLITTYLQLEKLRFRNDFNYAIHGVKAIKAVQIPAMLIQPFVENAIKHGLLHKDGIKTLRIDFQQNHEALHCTITDNGIGRKASEAINQKRNDRPASFSTSAIEKRFALFRDYYKLDLGFSYTDLEEENKPAGTQVILKIPYRNDDNE